jgi:hypothetical protein
MPSSSFNLDAMVNVAPCLVIRRNRKPSGDHGETRAVVGPKPSVVLCDDIVVNKVCPDCSFSSIYS